MTDTMLPILREMIDADGDAPRADVLLRVPDSILFTYPDIFARCCRDARFEAGNAFITMRVASLMAVRGSNGLLPANLDERLTSIRAALAQFSAGGAT
ncbi:hypothetical protein [Allomesorhizobium camelthorni]|uniref:Uncharacterized protein n=1 Tax=Allomesorhizobium camelthorni TaxID=475069 RepID=A0A6G4W6S5_9HYPH|nr:hypothetical protein [Mesorhizobium camelthorni]NGO50455.1 hypothetical protein [Mesorhizobium camelthorni]